MILLVADGPQEALINGRSIAQTSRPIIQNLGPGTLYIGNIKETLVDEGLQIKPNCAYEVPAPLIEGFVSLYIQADQTSCDVRILNVG